MPDGVFVIGAGGHAKVVISTLRAQGTAILGVWDDDASKKGSRVMGVPVLGSVREARGYAGKGRFILAIGDNRRRRELAENMKDFEWAVAVHPTAYVHSSVQLGPGSVVFAGAVVQPETMIGRHCIINTAATVDHDCEIGDYSHLAPGVHLAGGVVVGDESMLGVGASVIPNLKIGTRVVVGAGAVVVQDVSDGSTVVGVPARSIDGQGGKQ